MERERRKNRSKVRRGTPAERQAGATEYRDAVDRFQRSAFWNLRTRIANVSIVVGALALLVAVTGGADGARLAPTVLCVLGGLCGAAVYVSRPYPRVTRWLLIAAVSLTLLGIITLVVIVGAGG